MMRSSWTVFTKLVMATTMGVGAMGCQSPGQRAKMVKEIESLRRNQERLERSLADRDLLAARLTQQIRNLQELGPDRPAAIFAPVQLEIASLSGGGDYDGKPGDDGVTIYLRPRDADGDPVKAPGRIKVQLLDNSTIESPRPLGVYVFSEPEELRRAWYSRFGTQHYALKCPFPPEAALPPTRKLNVSVEFVDYLTGATLTAVRELTFDASDRE
jgi:hypothetical protein